MIVSCVNHRLRPCWDWLPSHMSPGIEICMPSMPCLFNALNSSTVSSSDWKYRSTICSVDPSRLRFPSCKSPAWNTSQCGPVPGFGVFFTFLAMASRSAVREIACFVDIWNLNADNQEVS